MTLNLVRIEANARLELDVGKTRKNPESKIDLLSSV
jgi:hypothetical protein